MRLKPSSMGVSPMIRKRPGDMGLRPMLVALRLLGGLFSKASSTGRRGWEKNATEHQNSFIAGGGSPGLPRFSRENRGFRPRLLKNLTLVAFFPSLGGPCHS
jgi:hypothetical protein